MSKQSKTPKIKNQDSTSICNHYKQEISRKQTGTTGSRNEIIYVDVACPPLNSHTKVLSPRSKPTWKQDNG